jgi:hypothetical protein
LGVLIDKNLTWNHHIHLISKKICKSIGIVYKYVCCTTQAQKCKCSKMAVVQAEAGQMLLRICEDLKNELVTSHQ